MERLTKYQQTEGGIPFVVAEDNQEAMQRLALIEDIFIKCEIKDFRDLENRLDHRFSMKTAIMEELKAYRAIGTVERCAELAKADEEGRLVALPCKLGKTIWFLCHGIIWWATPKYATENSFICQTCRSLHIDISNEWRYTEIIPFTEFGKTVFLTREEAEKALECEQQPLEERVGGWNRKH